MMRLGVNFMQSYAPRLCSEFTWVLAGVGMLQGRIVNEVIDSCVHVQKATLSAELPRQGIGYTRELSTSTPLLTASPSASSSSHGIYKHPSHHSYASGSTDTTGYPADAPAHHT